MLERISHRLIALIAVASAALLLVAGTAVVEMNSLGKQLEVAVDNSLPSVIVLGKMQSSFLTMRIALLSLVQETDGDKIMARQKEMQESLTAARQSIKDYEPLLWDDEDKQLLDADRSAIEAYAKAAEKVVSLADMGETAAAVFAIQEDLRPLAAATIAALDKHVQYNVDSAAADKAEAQQTISSGRVMIGAVVLVGMSLLMWFAYTAYQKVVGTAHRARDDVTRVVRELDFSHPLQVDGKDELSELLQALNQLIERLRSGLQEVRDNADRLANSSAEMAGSSQQVQLSSSSQSEAASSMAASIEEMTVSINHVADRTGEASRLASQSGQLAVGGRTSVSHTAERIGTISGLVDEAVAELGRLEESGNQISVVVGVIKDVADQTNLLALNAAIEAARAGEQGRGFAVVADEVRKLAERTASSTVEIANMVNAIQQRSAEVALRMSEAVVAVRDGVSDAEATRGVIDEIAASAEQSGQLVSEIATALSEQSTASNAISGQVEHVAQMAEENSQAAGRSAELAAELKQLAGAMQQTVAAYRLR